MFRAPWITGFFEGEFWKNTIGKGKFPIPWFGWQEAPLLFHRISFLCVLIP